MTNAVTVIQKTHFRKAFNSPYLSSADIVEPVTLTVQSARLEGDKSKKSKDLFNTIYFAEKEIRPGEALKPMILNATNSKLMKDITGSHFLEDWAGAKIVVHVESGIRFGRDIVDGLRIKKAQPKPQLQPDTQMWNNAIAAYKRDGNLEAVLKRVDISEENQKKIIEAAK